MYRSRPRGLQPWSVAATAAALVVAGLFLVLPFMDHLELRRPGFLSGEVALASASRPVRVVIIDGGGTLGSGAIPGLPTPQLAEAPAVEMPLPMPLVIMPVLEDFNPGPQVVQMIEFDLADLDSTPVLIHRTAPHYPPDLLASGTEGRVVVTFRVNETGRVIGVEIESAPHPEFAESVSRAVAHWRFMPGTIRGKPVRFRLVQPITFRTVSGKSTPTDYAFAASGQ